MLLDLVVIQVHWKWLIEFNTAHLGDRERGEEVSWVASPLPGQVEDEDNVEGRAGVNSPVVRPGSAAGITGPTPGVSPIQPSGENPPSSADRDQSQTGTTSTPHPGPDNEQRPSSRPGSANSYGHIDIITPLEQIVSAAGPDEVITIDQNTVDQSEA